MRAMKISETDETQVHLLTSGTIHNYEVSQGNVKGGRSPRITHAAYSTVRTEHHNEPNLAFTKKLIDQILLVFKVIAEFVQNVAAFSFFRIARKNEVEAYLIDHCSVINEARPKLDQERVLGIVFIGRKEDALYSFIDQSLERAFELVM